MGALAQVAASVASLVGSVGNLRVESVGAMGQQDTSKHWLTVETVLVRSNVFITNHVVLVNVPRRARLYRSIARMQFQGR